MTNATTKRALQYVKNTNGGASVMHFMDDHEPVGIQILGTLTQQKLVTTDEHGKIFLTQEGELALLGA